MKTIPKRFGWSNAWEYSMPVTLKEIADKVGKSVTTVSRALHGYNDVSPETKALVQQVASELGYTPNIFAQRLQKRRTDTIGFILPTFGPRFSDPFFSEFLAGIGNTAAHLNYDLLVSTRGPGEEELAAYREKVQGGRVDGFVIVRTRCQDERIEYLSGVDFPFVAFGRTESIPDYLFVDEDGEYGMRLIARHLVDLGHKEIAVITAPPHLTFTHYRLKGLREGLLEQGVVLDDPMIVTGDLTQKGGYSQTRYLLNLPTPPTAIVACNDLMALGAISATQEKGLTVGRDIAITGFDNIPLAEHCHPSLTTVNQPIYQIGAMVCEMLVKRIQGELIEAQHILLKPSLIIRRSCGGIPVDELSTKGGDFISN